MGLNHCMSPLGAFVTIAQSIFFLSRQSVLDLALLGQEMFTDSVPGRFVMISKHDFIKTLWAFAHSHLIPSSVSFLYCVGAQ